MNNEKFKMSNICQAHWIFYILKYEHIMKKLLLTTVLLSFLLPFALRAQEYAHNTFKDRRVINTQSVETLGKRRLDVRIAHRFGNLAGPNGGWQTLYGLENASDILIGAEYGLANNFDLGVFRTKGAGRMPDGTSGLRQLVNVTGKWRLMRQTKEKGNPFTMTLTGLTSISTARKAESNESALNSFPSFAHRLAYHGQLLIARKFSPGFSLQLGPGYTYRNLVPFNDENGIFNLSVATRIQLTKVFGLIADATIPFSDRRMDGDQGFYIPLGIGLEIDTGGHVFQVNFTNATALMETDYIPYTTSNWLDGEFRFGFTISRIFNL
jgi:hypothetical protein